MSTRSLHGTVKTVSKRAAAHPAAGKEKAVTPPRTRTPPRTGTHTDTHTHGRADAAVEDAVPRQSYIHATVLYEGSGGPLESGEAICVKYITDNFDVPAEFELDKVRFGQLSGLTYEKRLITAYMAGALKLKPGATYKRVCRACGTEGHFPDDCPEALKGF